MNIKDVIKEAHENADKKGFWEDFDFISIVAESGSLRKEEHATAASNALISTRLMLIVSEIGEAQEALRKNDRENFMEELADVAIRLFDLCGGLGIDLENEITKKMDKNKNRPYKHGKAF